MKWQFDGRQPIYLQIVDRLRLDIISGAYPPGERLPSVRDLAVEASVNPNTVQRALQELENSGLAESKRNTGRTVTTDVSAIEKSRSEMAERIAREFLSRTSQLGLTKRDVIALIESGRTEEETHGIDS